jgi:DNA helicase-2/ATP-dependent DNA helicase PcrA
VVPSRDYPYANEIEAMIAEAGEERGGGAAGTLRPVQVTLPSHLSTTDMVSLSHDSSAFALATLRPIPAEPRRAAGRGDAFHAWVERHYRVPTLLGAEDWPDGGEGANEGAVGDDAATSKLDELTEAFLSSDWANRRPEAVEAYVEITLGGVVVRCRIDAVFPPGSGLDRRTIVDWKTGRPPADEAARKARDVQLSVYRAAWAAHVGVPVEEIDAAFVYVATGETVPPKRFLTEEELGVVLGGGRGVGANGGSEIRPA